MGKTVVAFTAGLAVAAIAFLIVDRASEDSSNEGAANASTPSPTNRLQEDQGGVEIASVLASSSESAPSNANTESVFNELDASAATIEPVSALPPVSIYVPPMPRLVMPDGSEFPIRRASNIHSEMEREPKDPDWASVTEMQLQAFYSQDTALVESVGFPSIQCRSTLCLIQVVTDDPELRSIWQSESRKLFAQPWGAQFGGSPVSTRFYLTPENRAAMLMYLRKREEKSSTSP